MRQIRRKNGTLEMVDDDYILADGEGFVHSLMLMDGAVASGLGLGLHDGMGNPAGHKPGYVFADAGEFIQSSWAGRPAIAPSCRPINDAS